MGKFVKLLLAFTVTGPGGDQAINTVAVLVETVVGKLVQHPLEQQGSGCDANHQAKGIDEKMPVFGLEIYVVHGVSI